MKTTEHNHPKTVRRGLSITAGLLVAAGLFALGWRQSRQQAAVTHDFGVVALNVFKDLPIELIPDRKGLHHFMEAKALCDCLQVLESPPAGHVSDLPLRARVRFRPERPGPKKSELLVTWANERGRTLEQRLHFTANVIPQPEALPSEEAVKRAQGWLTQGLIRPAAEAVSGAEDQRFIDVRPLDRRSAGAIAGALQMPLSALASLPPALREGKTWIIDQGLGQEPVIETVSQLRESGWEGLRVLEGGVAGWLAAGGSAAPAVSAESPGISSEEARLCATRPGWVVVLPSALALNWHLGELFADRISYPDEAAPERIAEVVSAELAARRPGEGSTTSVLHVLVATESGERAALIATALRARAAGSPVFVLEGGVRGYMEHLRQLRPMEESHWTTLADYRGVLADLRARQRLVSSCSSCAR